MTIDEAMKTAIEHHQSGRLPEAERIYRQVLAERPDHADALHLLGVLAGQVGRNDAAIELISRSIRLQPNLAEAHVNLGVALDAMGRLDEAIAAYNRAIQLQPNYAEAHCSLGNSLWGKGRLEEAIAANNRAIQLKPDYAEAHNNLGAALRDCGRLNEAVASFRRAIQLRPDYVEANSNLGATLREMGRLDEAIAACQRAIQLKPDHANAHNNLAAGLEDSGRLDEAIAAYHIAIQLNPNYAEAHANLGNALRSSGRFDQAIAAYNRAIQLKPGYAEAHSNRGVILKEMGQLDEAIVEFNLALELEPDNAGARLNLAMLLLLLGDFRRGWREYESRWNAKPLSAQPRRFSQPRWDGGDLHGKTILLGAEQGLGDALQFIRYAPLVAADGGRVVVECRPPLKRLFENIDQISQVICDDEPPPNFDLQCPLLSLPLVMKTDCLEAIPANVPYVRPLPASVASWRERLRDDEGELKVGLVWAGSPKNRTDRQRSLQLQSLAPLAGAEKVTFYSLQLGPAAQQAHDPPAGMKLIDCSADLRDLADTAGLVANLDLVICVDTAVAHLAGAMAKPVWTLLKFSPDWRWLRDRDDSPWYPTMRLFRQPRNGDWAAAIQTVAEQLRRQVTQNPQRG